MAQPIKRKTKSTFPNNIIFIDFDNIIDETEWWKRKPNDDTLNIVKKLKSLLQDTKSELVLISESRSNYDIYEKFETYTGIKLFSITNPFFGEYKNDSIADWLSTYNEHKFIWIIIDTNNTYYNKEQHFFQYDQNFWKNNQTIESIREIFK